MSVDVPAAMVLSAGLGTRLRPLTDRTPKPLVQVGGRALIDFALDRFAEHAVQRVVVNTHHLADQVRQHLQERERDGYGPALHITHEPQLLESGGGVVHALKQLAAPHFFTANADAAWLDEGEPATRRMAAAFDPARMDALLLLQPLDRAVGYHGPGNFALTGQGALRRDPAAGYVFTGLALWDASIFDGMQAQPWSLRRIFDARKGEDQSLHRMHGLVHHGDFLHVGTPAELSEVEAFVSRQT